MGWIDEEAMRNTQCLLGRVLRLRPDPENAIVYSTDDGSIVAKLHADLIRLGNAWVPLPRWVVIVNIGDCRYIESGTLDECHSRLRAEIGFEEVAA